MISQWHPIGGLDTYKASYSMASHCLLLIPSPKVTLLRALQLMFHLNGIVKVADACAHD